MRLCHEDNHSSLPTAKFNKEWKYTSTPLYVLRTWVEKTLPFLQFVPHSKHYISIISIDQLILDFKISPCSECCVISFGWFPDVWILSADVSEHSVCSIFVDGVSRKILLAPPTKMELTGCSEKSTFKIQSPGNHPKERIQQLIQHGI